MEKIINVPGLTQRRTPPDAPNPGDRYYDVIKERIMIYEANEWKECVQLVTPEPSAISIKSGNGLEVLRIEVDGRVFWREPGSTELTQVKIEEDLSLAFAVAIETISGLTGSTLMSKIKEDAVREYLNKKASD